MTQRVLDKINMLSEDIDLRTKDNSNISILNGIGSLPIFYYLKFKLTNNKEYINKIHTTLEKIIELINETHIEYTYSNGLIGVAHMFNFIKKKNILNPEALIDIEEALLIIDETVVELSFSKTNSIDDTDFLHGSFGGALYLIERFPDNNSEIFKSKVIELFEKLALIILEDIEKTKKISNLIDFDENAQLTNCGLAHGHVSYIIILSKFLENNPGNKLIKDTLIASVECLLGFQSDSEESFSQFPSIAMNKSTAKYSVSLGWCYGDQTISLGLYKAANILKDENLKQKALDLAYKTLKRDTTEKIFASSNWDAGFCHGLSSVAYIHKKWYSLSKDKSFYEQYEKYISDILDYGDKEIGVAGYQKFAGKNGYEDSIGFLEGAIGIGIVLMDYLLEFDDTGWDKFFLLDINN